jgi:hypothetical protein
LADTEWVEMHHPDLEGTYRAPATAVEHYERAGWRRVDDPAPKPAARAPEKKAEG